MFGFVRVFSYCCVRSCALLFVLMVTVLVDGDDSYCNDDNGDRTCDNSGIGDCNYGNDDVIGVIVVRWARTGSKTRTTQRRDEW